MTQTTWTGPNVTNGSITGVVRPKTPRRQLLEEAANTVDGARDQEYGGPEESFRMISDTWNALGFAPPFTPTDVAMMMAALKLARLSATDGGHSDSWVDLAGYAACGAEVRVPQRRPVTNKE